MINVKVAKIERSLQEALEICKRVTMKVVDKKNV